MPAVQELVMKGALNEDCKTVRYKMKSELFAFVASNSRIWNRLYVIIGKRKAAFLRQIMVKYIQIHFLLNLRA